MPLTPFHLGPALLFGIIFFRRLDFAAFAAGNVIVDIEPFLVLMLGLDLPLHGIFHSIIGGTIMSLALCELILISRTPLRRSLSRVHLWRETSKTTVLLSCFLGILLHIFLDSFLYSDIMPFYPLEINPALGRLSMSQTYSFCAACFTLGLALYLASTMNIRGFSYER